MAHINWLHANQRSSRDCTHFTEFIFAKIYLVLQSILRDFHPTSAANSRCCIGRLSKLEALTAQEDSIWDISIFQPSYFTRPPGNSSQGFPFTFLTIHGQSFLLAASKVLFSTWFYGGVTSSIFEDRQHFSSIKVWRVLIVL